MAKRFDRHNRQGVLHYLTLCVRDRVQAFSADEYMRATAAMLRLYCDKHPAKLIAYVIMPEHLHAIVNPRDGNILHFLSQFKPAVTHQVAEIATLRQQERVLQWLQATDGHFHLWQDGKHNFHLYSERLIWQKINYMHTNPIRRGLTATAAEYPYSSFRAMYEEPGEIVISIDRDFWWCDEELPLVDEGF